MSRRRDALEAHPQYLVALPGVAGERYSPAEAGKALGVDARLVVKWIERGWLRASATSYGYRIRRKALRRALMDVPEVADAAMRAHWKRIEAQGKLTKQGGNNE